MYKLCKTEQSALRQRELERMLAAMMLEHRYEDITVSEFCSYAGIPRKAFYRYFSSKEGALFALIDHCLMEYEGFRRPTGFMDREALQKMEQYFTFWKDQKLILDALAVNGLTAVLLERAILSLETLTVNRRIPADRDPVQWKTLSFLTSGVLIMTTNWHRDGFRESPREMAELVCTMLSAPLIHYIQELL